RLISRYSSGRPKYPVIIIVDNDKAGREIRAKGVTNQAMPLPTAPDNAFFISHNLYLIEIPKFGNKDTVIEDYFDQIVKATKVDNRSLNLAKTKINHEKFYGK